VQVQVQVLPERVQVKLCEMLEALGAVLQALGQYCAPQEELKPPQVELGQVQGLAERVWVQGLTVWVVGCWALCCEPGLGDGRNGRVQVGSWCYCDYFHHCFCCCLNVVGNNYDWWNERLSVWWSKRGGLFVFC